MYDALTDGLIDEDRLLAIFGCQRRGVLKRLLKSNHVRFLAGSEGRLFTTREAINEAMGVRSPTIDTLLTAVKSAMDHDGGHPGRARLGPNDAIPDGEIVINPKTPLRPRGRAGANEAREDRR